MVHRKDVTKNKRLSTFITGNNRGTTMVETLVAFVVLMIVIAALYAMFRFSSNLRMRAVDSANVRSEFNGEIYKDTPDTTKVVVNKYLGKRAKDKTTMFMLKVNTAPGKTTTENLYIGTDPGNDYTKSIRIPAIDAYGYVSVDPRITDEDGKLRMPTPKVLSFEYYKTPKSD